MRGGLAPFVRRACRMSLPHTVDEAISPEVLASISGHELLSQHLGHWPTFHDFEYCRWSLSALLFQRWLAILESPSLFSISAKHRVIPSANRRLPSFFSKASIHCTSTASTTKTRSWVCRSSPPRTSSVSGLSGAALVCSTTFRLLAGALPFFALLI